MRFLAMLSATFVFSVTMSPAQAATHGALPDAPQAAADAQKGQSTGPTPSGREQTAEQQVKKEEHQRVLGLLPDFAVVYQGNAAPLSGTQKMELAFRSAVDPARFAFAAIVAGDNQANRDQRAYGWGAEGFAKRFGAAYVDEFDGQMLGVGVLPAVLHQDPRYFRRGHGSGMHRLMYALATTVICKHDNTGRWEPNYSNVGGTLAAGAISNVYYPAQDSGVTETFVNSGIVLAEGAVGSILAEFWPDVSRRVLHRDPTHGADEKVKAADRARAR